MAISGRRRPGVRYAAAALCLTALLGGCVSDVSSPTARATASVSASAPTTVDADGVLAAVRALPGVTSSTVNYSPDRLGYPASFAGRITVTSQADPVDVLDRALFLLLRDSRAATFAVTVARDGLLYDGQQLGLRTAIDRAELAARFGSPARGATFPTPPPPRPSPAPAPRSSTP